jgi:hypothetical protein
MLSYDRNHLLGTLLEFSIDDFDIPTRVRELAEARYHSVSDWLDRYWGRSFADGYIYPQGSFRLGTVVRPVDPDGDYDIDLVCRRDLKKGSTTQTELKRELGEALEAYVGTGPEGSPTLHEGKRCWTLAYANDHFHMDVLPAIPNEEALPNGINITDRTFRLWLPSNPVDYSSWFYARMSRELAETRSSIALSKRMEVEDVPDWQVKTTLQRTVQALKRHRDFQFAERPDEKPASIIISTLAARAYSGGGDLTGVMAEIAANMPNFIEKRGEVYWVANPVQPDENFADRWQTEPGRKEAFFDWIEEVHADFVSLNEHRDDGIDTVFGKMAGMFGDSPTRAARERYGNAMSDARNSRALGSAAVTAMLGAVAPKGSPLPNHTFHGGTEAPPA